MSCRQAVPAAAGTHRSLFATRRHLATQEEHAKIFPRAADYPKCNRYLREEMPKVVRVPRIANAIRELSGRGKVARRKGAATRFAAHAFRCSTSFEQRNDETASEGRPYGAARIPFVCAPIARASRRAALIRRGNLRSTVRASRRGAMPERPTGFCAGWKPPGQAHRTRRARRT